jgi:hypothetical protein
MGSSLTDRYATTFCPSEADRMSSPRGDIGALDQLDVAAFESL